MHSKDKRIISKNSSNFLCFDDYWNPLMNNDIFVLKLILIHCCGYLLDCLTNNVCLSVFLFDMLNGYQAQQIAFNLITNLGK